MGTPINITDADFTDKVLLSQKPVLVDFWAEWCAPCKQVAPVLAEIAAEHDGLTIAKIDIDANPVVAANEGITSIPTLNVYVGGKLVKQIVGAKPKRTLLTELSDYLS